MPQVAQRWIAAACERLYELRTGGVGWGYRTGGPAYTEPTALGCLALLAGPGTVSGTSGDIVDSSCRWLADLQQVDGSVGLSAEQPAPRWPTAMASLAWAQREGFEGAAGKSVNWLLERQGHVFPRTPDCVLGHDTSIPGWPWVAGTHPWVEPSAMAMLALCRQGRSGHGRVRDGVRLIQDRAIPGSGWNMGNKSVFGRTLRPQIGPTGLALLALRAAGRPETEAVKQACVYLAKALPTTRSSESLGWGLLGLTAWRPRPTAAANWLAESYRGSPALHRSPSRLALLILAASSRAHELLGVGSLAAGEPLYGNLQA